MQKITTHLWFDKEAKEAAALYVSLFPNSRIKSTNVLEGTPSGNVDIVDITLAGQDFTLLAAGPLFKFTPAISFMVYCSAKEEVDAYRAKLIEGGKELMPLDAYPFSERYCWLEDRYGLSWQFMYRSGEPPAQKITPTLMFVGGVCGKAEEAVGFYASIFPDSRIGHAMRYEAGEEPNPAGTIKHGGFTLAGSGFAAMDSAYKHDFAFNEAISFIVHCKDQAEIDYYWDKLSAVPEAEQCGWLKDKYGVSWQIVPIGMDAMMASGDKQKIARVTEAFLKMKKFDLAKLEEAANRE